MPCKINIFGNSLHLIFKTGLMKAMECTHNIFQYCIHSLVCQPPKKETHVTIHQSLSHPFHLIFACFQASVSSLNILPFTHRIWNARNAPEKLHKNL